MLIECNEKEILNRNNNIRIREYPKNKHKKENKVNVIIQGIINVCDVY